MQRLEGLRLRAEPLDGEGFVIGHGHLSAADPAREITAEEARALLLFDLSRTAARIEPMLLASVTDAQFDALLSFAFAVGVDAFARSAVLKRLNAGAYLDAAAALELWRVGRVAGEPQVVDHLVRRRAAEKARFLDVADGAPAFASARLRAEEDAAVLRLADGLRDGRPVHRFGESGRDPEPAPSAALAVVAALSARLDQLIPTPPSAEPEPDPAPEPEADGGLEPEPPPLIAAPEPDSAAAPKPLEPPEPAPPLAVQLGPEAPVEALAPPAEPPEPRQASAGRPATNVREPHPRASEPRVSPPSLRGPAFVLGVLGLLLFVFAVFKTYQAPSLAWLGFGLLGVAAMAPASLHLIGPRRRDED